MKQLIYGVLFTIICTGLVYAMDQRVDQRIQHAISAWQEQDVEQKIQFYIMKEELAPDAITPDDRVNKTILERQLEQLRGIQ